MNTLGLFPDQDGVFPPPMRENLFTAKASANLTPIAVPVGPLRTQHQLAGLWRHDAPRARQLGRQREQVQLDQHEPQLGARRIEAERVRVPVSPTSATTSRRAPATRSRPSRTASSSATTPTRRRRPNSTSSSSATTSRGRITGMGGLGHDFKAGVNFINEPHLFVTFSSGSDRLRVHPPDRTIRRPDQRHQPQQAGRVGQPADEAVRHVLSGRLARHRPPDG